MGTYGNGWCYTMVAIGMWKSMLLRRNVRRMRGCISAASFYVHKLPMLRIPADVHDELKRKVVHNSAGAQELFASIKDDLARSATLDWISEQKKVPVRVLEKRVRALNWNAPLLAEIEDEAEKERVTRLVLEKGLSPRSFELELRRLLPRSRESTMPFGVDGVQLYCPADSADMSQIEDGSVRFDCGISALWSETGFRRRLHKQRRNG